MGQNSCQPEGLQPESALAALLVLAIETTIVFTGRLAITNSGCNAHVFHYVRHSNEREPTHADVLARGAIAVPFDINRRWVLWQAGGPGGNARKEFLAAWNRILPAFRAYP